MISFDPEAQEPLQEKPAAGMGQERNEDAPKPDDNDLEERIRKELVNVVRKFERETDIVRRHHVRRFLEAEEFWKGNQHLIWSERNFRWHTPFEYAVEQGQQPGNLPKYQYVTNIYQAFGLSIIAALSQKLPKVRFSPKSAKSERDIATAKAASNVAELIEDNNNLDLLSVRYAYLMWTQGIFGAYVRYVVDKDFGTTEVPQVDMVPVTVAPDRYECPQCATETPAEDLMPQGGMAPQGGAAACAGCGGQLTEQDFRPEEVGEGPVITKYIQYPQGQEVITVYGGLNLKLHPNANSQKESPYLILSEEKPVAAIRAAYPNLAKKIGAGGGNNSGDSSPDGQFEKTARLGLADAPPYQKNLAQTTGMATLTRAWLRDWALWAIDDEAVRDEMLQRYPDGVLVVLADDEFMEAIAEDMDAHWEICMPMPGQGMYREAVGSSTIPIQKRYNDAANVQAEHIEFGSAPPVFFDARYINREALEKRRMQPANFFPVVTNGAPAATDITKLMYQPKMTIDSNIYQYGKDLIELTQMVSGAMPSLFGGPIQNNYTADGYRQSTQNSLGKLSLFWRSVKQFQARLMLKGVECFRDNRTDDVERVIFGKSGDYTSKWIHLEDLRGNVTAKPETDEDFPATWSEIRENIIALIQQVPDFATKILQHPANAPLLRKFIANEDIVFPMEDDREKQYREIDELLQAQPVIDPMTGSMQTSIPPEPFVDDHDAHIMTAKEFAVSDEGMEAKKTNPAGYANLMLHIVAHYQAKAEAEGAVQSMNSAVMNQAAATAAPPQAQGEPAGAGNDGGGGQSLGDAIEGAVPGIGDAVSNVLGAQL